MSEFPVVKFPETLFPELTDPKKRAFLAAYTHTGRVTYAAKAAHTNWRSHYNWLHGDPLYAAAFAMAKRMVGDFLEDEAMRRAMEGVTKSVYYGGEVVGEEKIYSDVLLIFLLKGAKPDTYREHVDLRLSQEIAAKQIGAELGVSSEDLLAEARRAIALIDMEARAE